MRRKIYLQPLGEFAASCSPSLECLREYATIYFALETDTLLAVQEKHFTTRVNPLTQNRQILTTDVLRFSAEYAAARCVLRSGDHDGGFVSSGASLELSFSGKPRCESASPSSASHDTMRRFMAKSLQGFTRQAVSLTKQDGRATFYALTSKAVTALPVS
jgi:hypothetical protein